MHRLPEQTSVQTTPTANIDSYLPSWKNLFLFILPFLGASFIAGIILGIIGGMTNAPSLLSTLQGYIELLIEVFAFLVAFLSFKSIRKFVQEIFNLAPIY